MIKTKIHAEVVGHSFSPQGDELISVLCTFPRIILAEVNTHRMLSKNTSSSRAIPFNKMVEAIQNNPFIPIAWQKEHTGMQGTEYFTNEVDVNANISNWLEGRDRAVATAFWLNESKVTKQLCNRLLEPFMWTTMLITGSREGWDNFFKLRCPQYNLEGIKYKSRKDWNKASNEKGGINYNEDATLHWLQMNEGQAEIHMMALAEAIYDAVNESTPKQLKTGEWHIPFEDRIDYKNIPILGYKTKDRYTPIKISVAMAARTSYTVVGDEKEISYEKMIDLHDKLLNQQPPHSSPLEHCARAMSDEEYYSNFKGKLKVDNTDEYYTIEGCNSEGNGWCYNLKGFIPYRYMIDNNKM